MAKKAETAKDEVKKTTKTTKAKTEDTSAKIESTEKKPVKAKKTKDISELFTEIEKRSYELYLERKASGSMGSDLDDWMHAEEEIKVKYGIK